MPSYLFKCLLAAAGAALLAGTAAAQEGQSLAWVRPQKLDQYAMPPADKPLVAMLRDLL